MSKKAKETDVQGTEVSHETELATAIQHVADEKKRSGNILYTMRQFTQMINKMKEQELIDGVQLETLKQMAKQITTKYIGLDMF